MLRTFYDQNPERKPADNPVSNGKVLWVSRRAHGKLRNQKSFAADFLIQLAVVRWVQDVDATSQHCDRLPLFGQGGTMCCSIDASCEAADDRKACLTHVRTESFGGGDSVGRRPPRTHDSDTVRRQKFCSSTDIQENRRNEDFAQARRIQMIVNRDQRY